MALATWDQSYSVSVSKFDEQHEKLFSLLNALHDAMGQGKGQAMVESTLNELALYTVTHFRAEEELLRKTNFPGFAAHHAEHQKFVARVKGFIEEVKSGHSASAIAVLGFIKEWLTEHIMKTDRAYGAYLNAKGVR